MAEQIISPGVFTRENDLSFLPQGVGAIGAAVVGPTEKGPAFIPTVVRSFEEFERNFGPLSTETYVPQTAREYLKNAGSVTIVRVLAGGGYTTSGTTSTSVAIIASGSGTQSPLIIGVLMASKNAATTPDLSSTTLTLGQLDTVSDRTLVINGSNVTTQTNTVSLNPSSVNYYTKVVGSDPNNSKTATDTFAGIGGYVYVNFKSIHTAIHGNTLATLLPTHEGYLTGSLTNGYDGDITGSTILAVTQSSDMVFNGNQSTTEGYAYAETPMVQSQLSLGQKDLFQFHTIDHGSKMAKQYKVSIANLKEPSDIDGVEQHSSFSVIIRKYIDQDKTPFILEQFNNCNLNPNDSNYIARVIGDRYPQYNQTLDKVELLGNYSNKSKYIRVSVSEAVKAGAMSPKISPKGFAALRNPINVVYTNVLLVSAATYPSASFEDTQTLDGGSATSVAREYNAKGYLGFMSEEKEPDSMNFTLPLPVSHAANSAGAFNIENYNGHPSSSLWSGSLSASIDTTGAEGPTNSQLKFSLPFQGGDDGLAPYAVKKIGSNIAANNLYGFDLSTNSSAGYTAYKKALNILSNQDEYDINMLALPGVIHKLHPLITNKGIDMCETRGDCFYVMDLNEQDASVATAIDNASGLDTNYAAVYYPWVKVIDSARNQPILVPPSVIVPGAIAASDRIGAEWFAPAGLNRGVLGNVIETKIRLNQSERDQLYNEKINPIATFPQTGVCIWGQKTLQERSTALNRINVRRLLITLKKFIASSSKYLVFEQNTLQTRIRFLNIVNPYLESVQQQQGLYAFRVVMDETNNTPDVIDRNQLVGAIYLQPAKTAEFIVLDFNVLPTGATFPS